MALPNSQVRPTTSPRRRRALLLLAAAIAFVITFANSSCAGPTDKTSNSSVQPSTSRSVHDYPVVWFETENLDLATPDGTFVRSVFESYILRSELGPSAYFPGWAEATGDSWYHWPNRRSNGPRNGPPFTIFAWVAPFIDPDPAGIADWASPSKTVGRVMICSRTSRNVDYTMIFTYQRTGTAPPANQHGNQPTPTRNVYGNWTILDSIDPFRNHIDRAERCDTPPAPISQDVHASSPGWPASSQ